MEKQTMGKLIASGRKTHNLTQAQLAEIMNVTDKAVSKWERDLSCPDVSSLPRLAQTLELSVDELVQCKAKAKTEAGPLDMILKAVPLAMGVAVFVLSLLGQIEAESALGLLAIGLIGLSIAALRRDRTM